jgi:hypothetical protein
MTPHCHHTAPRQHTPLVEGILQREAKSITCQREARGHRTHELCILPHWNPSAAVIERFDAPLPAMMRHAQLARDLREAGWRVTDHVAATRVHAAA